MTSQATSKATPCAIPEGLAICGKVVSSTVWDGLEIKPHLGGHWANTQPSVTDQLELSNALTSTQCCPLAVSSATRGTHQSLTDPAKPASQREADGMQIVKK